MIHKTVPIVITFDGEARSGKGTIVQATKDYLREASDLKVMLIDRGQTFRVLVVAVQKAGINLNDWEAVDQFLTDESNITYCTQFVKDVYRMTKEERDGLIYTNEVGEGSAIIGLHAASQVFVKNLTKKWIASAGEEGYEVVLIDGRTLEEISAEMDEEGLCHYALGLYFICDPYVGARRTLSLAHIQYNDLSATDKQRVDELVSQIHERNKRDKERDTERLTEPVGAPTFSLPLMPHYIPRPGGKRTMLIVDTSAEITKSEMSDPVAQYVHSAITAK